MTYTLAPNSPKKASAVSFGRELLRAIETRGIPRNELWRATKIGRTALDNYRTGAVLPRTEPAAALASVLEWPKLLEIVRLARTRPCQRCGRDFTNDGGNQGAKRYCSVACRELAAQEKLASSRIRKAGQTDDARQTRAAIQRLRSGIRIAEERSSDLAMAIDAMCRDCEPQGICRTADCPLRAFSPLPFQVHDTAEARTMAEIRVELDRKAAPKRSIAMARRHAAGEIKYMPKGDRRHPANDPARRAGFIAAVTEGKARSSKARLGIRRPLSDAHKAAIAAGNRAAAERRRQAKAGWPADHASGE